MYYELFHLQFQIYCLSFYSILKSEVVFHYCRTKQIIEKMSALSIPVLQDGDLKVKSEFLIPEEKRDREDRRTEQAKGEDKKQKQRGRNKDR
jgi:hypothetical protein